MNGLVVVGLPAAGAQVAPKSCSTRYLIKLPTPVVEGAVHVKVTVLLLTVEEAACGAEAGDPGTIVVLVIIVSALVPAEF